MKKTARGNKKLQSIKKPLSIKTRLLSMNALVISHRTYPAILLNRIASNLAISLENNVKLAQDITQ